MKFLLFNLQDEAKTSWQKRAISKQSLFSIKSSSGDIQEDLPRRFSREDESRYGIKNPSGASTTKQVVMN